MGKIDEVSIINDAKNFLEKYNDIALLADLGSQMYVFSDDRSSVFKYQKLREKMDNYGYENLKGQVCTPAFATTMLQKGVITFEQPNDCQKESLAFFLL